MLMVIIAILALVVVGCGGEVVEHDDTNADGHHDDAIDANHMETPVIGSSDVDEMIAEDVLDNTDVEDIAPPQEVKSFTMEAKQFEFIPSIITVNEGDLVKLAVTSSDVDHGLAIPAFGVREALSPGKLVNVEFVADKKGTFEFFCSVSCGSGHGGMRGTLVVK